jgi:hypothetical protein
VKLLNCTACHDLVKLQDEWRPCACGLSSARYLRDGRTAEVRGHGRILGLDGDEYSKSLQDPRARMELSVMADSHPRVRRVRPAR